MPVTFYFTFFMPVLFPSKYIKLLVLLSYFLCSTYSYSQTVDSLKQYSYEELDSLFYAEFYKENSTSEKYAIALLERALANNNKKQEATSHLKLAQLYNRDAIFKKAHTHVDIAISLAEQEIKNDSLKNEFLLYKAGIFYNSTNYKKALTYYTDTYQYYYKLANNEQRIIDIAHSIASIKSLVGDEKEAKKIFKENYQIYTTLEKDSSKTFRKISYINTLIALSDTYIDEAIAEKNLVQKNILLDSATYYNTIGFDKSKKYEDLDGYNYFLIRKAIVLQEKGNYQDAISDFKLAIQKANEIGQNATLTTIYFHLANSYEKLNDLDTSIDYFKKIDSLSSEDIEQSTYLPETYIALANLYKKKGDPTNAMKYYDSYVEIDKLNDEKTIEIRKKIIEDYELKVLKNEIEELKEENEDSQTNYKTALIVITILIFILLIVFTYNKKKQQKNRLVFEDLMKQLEAKKKEGLNKSTSKKEEKSKSKLTIDEEKVNDILKALEKFEEKKQFLDNNCDLGFVAKKVKTNKAYLSKVIHTEKQQKFIQYITNLRINYALEKLKEDKLFRSYDIKSIASELGFKSPDSFSRAFKNKTGIYPSYYIKNINKINSSEEK